MNKRKKPAQKRSKGAVHETLVNSDTPQPARVDWSEPAERVRPNAYDVERDIVPEEVGPHEPEVDPRLEH